MKIEEWQKNVDEMQVNLMQLKDKNWIKWAVLALMIFLAILFWKLDWMLWARIMTIFIFIHIVSNIKYLWRRISGKN